MQTQALTRSTALPNRRDLNPAHFKAEALELMQANPALAAQSMTQLALSKRDAERELNISRESTNDLVAFAVSTGLVALIGLWDGSVMAKRDAIIAGFEEQGLIGAGDEPNAEIWKAAGVKEPGKLFGVIPMGLLVPVAFGVMSVIAAARRDERAPAGTFERVTSVTATTTFGVWVAGMTRASGYRRQQTKMVTAAAAAAMTGT